MLTGKRISGRYKIIEMIGGGGMSNVYLAHDMILDRDVAIKVLRYDFSNEEELRRRFQREAQSATSLTHPNIVNIFDVGEDEDMQYLVMEYVHGKTLKQYIQEKAPLAPAKCVAIMKQLTSAIANAHQNQIIHRDIKPQNILMDQEGNVKITDFGIAMALSATSYTQTNSVLGTVHYLSPEQARGGTATKKSDIYALGIVLYELLTRELPFSGESAVSIALKHLQAETPSVRAVVPSIPQSLENVVLKATAKDPLHRYRSVEEMQRDLETVLSEERKNEEKFQVPIDEEATKAIPVIREPAKIDNLAETKAIDPIKTIPDEKKKKKKKWPWIVGGVFGLLFIFLLLMLMFPGIFGPQKIEIPNLSGVELKDAEDQIKKLGFEVGEQVEQTSKEIEKGKVIKTDPPAGSQREKGSKINFIISSGQEQVDMMDYTGRDVEQVVALLQKQDYKSIDVKKKYSNKPVGVIIEQNPAGGSKIVPSETDLVFTVSDGPQMIKINDLTGYNENALNDYAKSSGFNIRITKEEFHDTIPAGNVISQSPKANEQAAAGSSIDVVISKGPNAKPVKMYVQTVEIPFEPTDGGKEQVVRIYIQDRTRTMAEPVEEFTIKEKTKKKIQLEIEKGQKAAFRIVRDTTVIVDQTITYDSLE